MGRWWRLVLRRTLTQRSLAVAASVLALLAATVLAALGEYAASVTGEGLHATLASAAFGTAGTTVTTTVPTGRMPAADRKVREAVRTVYGRVPADVSLSAYGDSYVVPGQERKPHPRLTVFATYSGIEAHARLRTGRWPAATPGGVVEAALPEPAARAMGLVAGRVVTLHGRVGGPPVTVRVSGLFAVNRSDDYVWGGDRLVTTGVERLDYTTVGPFVVPAATFSARFAATATVRWLVLPDMGAIGAGQVHGIQERAQALPASLGRGAADGTGYAVNSSLPDLLTQVGRAVLVTRSTLLIPALLVLMLITTALLLLARLLAGHRQVETALMRSRGAGARQLALLAVAEAAVLSVPAAVAAPFLAPLLIRAAAATPLLRTSGTHAALSPSALTWGVAAATAVICVVVLALPSLGGIRRTYVATITSRGREGRQAVFQRAGADLALVLVAGLAMWRLVHYRGPVLETSSGNAGIDPFIVAGPSLGLLAGGALLLRVAPIASRAGEWATSFSRGFALAVGAHQVSRRPLRVAGPVLLLVMTVATGVLCVATGSTWRRSQLDQADFQAGADLRIAAPASPSSPAAAGQGGRYAALPGVTAAGPVLRDTVSTGGADAALLAVDSGRLGGTLRARTALGSDAPTRRLAAGGGPGVPITGRPERLSVAFRIGRTPDALPVSLSVLVSDAFDVVYEIDLGKAPADGDTHLQVADVAGLAGRDGVISYPIAVRGFRFTYPQTSGGPADLTVTEVRGGTGARLGPPVRRPAGAHWTGQVEMSDGGSETAGIEAGGLVTTRLPAGRDDYYFPNATTTGVVVLRAGDRTGGAATDGAGPIPAIVTRELAARAHAGVGGRITITENGVQQPLTIVGVAPALPSAEAGSPGVLVDWAALADASLAVGVTPKQPAEWWLATRGGDTAATARALHDHPAWGDRIVDRVALRHRLRDTPLGGSLQGALVLGFAGAIVFAVIGLAVDTVVSARERAVEFAVLRVLGVSGRQVVGLIAVEQGFLVGLGLLGGVLLGVVVAHLVLPYVVLTVRATAPYPPVHVVLQWPVVVAMVAGMTAAFALTFLVLVRHLTRDRLGRLMRVGEDR